MTGIIDITNILAWGVKSGFLNAGPYCIEFLRTNFLSAICMGMLMLIARQSTASSVSLNRASNSGQAVVPETLIFSFMQS